MDNKILKVVNPLLGLLMLLQVLTILLPKLIPGILPRGLVFEIHEYNGYLIFILVCVHLFLNRWWLKDLFKSNQK